MCKYPYDKYMRKKEKARRSIIKNAKYSNAAAAIVNFNNDSSDALGNDACK